MVFDAAVVLEDSMGRLARYSRWRPLQLVDVPVQRLLRELLILGGTA